MAGRTRRNLLWLGGIALAYGAVSSAPRLVHRLLPPGFDFAAIPGLPGFRRIDNGSVAAGAPFLIGLEPPSDTESRTTAPGLRADLCTHLFGAAQGQGGVPVAYFTDVNCRYCRVLTPLLMERATRDRPPIRLSWHHLPLFGAGSVLAARAALAADRQGAGPAFHARLARARLVPTPASLRRLAGEMGLDGDRLLRDMNAPDIDRDLAISAGLADLFGFPGTPGLVVGRTAVLGRIEAADLDRLIALEAEEQAAAPCA